MQSTICNFHFFFLDKVTDAKIDSTFQCRQWLIYQWFHPNIDPTLPGYQWQSMYIGNCTHKRIWEMHGERVIYVACSRHSDGGDRVNLYTASAKKTQGKKWWETGVGVREFSIFCLHPTNNFPCTLGYGDVSSRGCLSVLLHDPISCNAFNIIVLK